MVIEAIVTFLAEEIIGGAVRAEEAQTGGSTGTLKTVVAQRAAAQIAAGTAIPIPADRLAAFELASGPFPLTGQSRRFAFVGEGSTLTIAQRVALGILQEAGPDPRFSPHFSLQSSARVPSLSQLVGRQTGGPSLSDRLRTQDGNLGLLAGFRRPDWPELLTG